MKRLFYILFLCVVNLQAQLPSDSIKHHEINTAFLEHLIKVGIDSVRNAHDCEPLINDSILYVASKHHSDYMQSVGKISHEETNKKTRTPQMRAEFYGAKNYGVGENVLFTYYNETVRGKGKKLHHNYTYKALAHNIVIAWVNSPGHFKNIINCDYQITGLSFTTDKKTKRIYVCQKFAQVRGKYEFDAFPKMFPYDSYKKHSSIDSFDGIVPELQDHDHEWGLRHQEQEKCNSCIELVENSPEIILKKKDGFFILKIQNSAFVKQLLKNENDGFAVEIVTFDDYYCGNPDYYTKASRRNKQCRINGYLLQPMYKEALYKGFKKRKKKKDVSFVSYLFGADSVDFKDRFKQFKFDKFSSEYFEIRLAKVPKEHRYWAHNLIYIQDGEICHTSYFTRYCGELYNDTIATQKLYPEIEKSNYEFIQYKEELTFSIPFEKNKFEYKEADVKPFLSTLNNLAYDIDSLHIIAYSSVEGNQEHNLVLQRKRAESIAKVLTKHQKNNIPSNIVSQSSWSEFLNLSKKTPRLRFLNSMSKEALKDYVDTHANELEKVLQKQRKADIRMYCTINNDRKNLSYLIKKEYQSFQDSLFVASKDERINWINKMATLYNYCHQQVQANKVDVNVLIDLELPKDYYKHKTWGQEYYLVRYLYQEDFNKRMSPKYHEFITEMEKLYNYSLLKDKYFAFNYLQYKSKKLLTKENVKQAEVQAIYSDLEKMKSAYDTDKALATQIDRVNYNMNFLLLNKVFTKNRKEKKVDAIKSIAQIKRFYNKYDLMSANKALLLAETAVFYNDINYAFDLMRPYAEDDQILAYKMALMYKMPYHYGGKKYIALLLDAKAKMNIDTWCNMFMSRCGIPFQIMESEAIHDVFCEECLDKNEIIQELLE